ncbi:hypothetical protein Tco_0210264 [Tanacetum coccineum]
MKPHHSCFFNASAPFVDAIHGFAEPSSAEIVFNQCTQNLECPSSSEKRKRTPQEDPMSSEVHHEADFGNVPTCVLTDHAHTTVTTTGVAPPSLNVETVANNDAAT